MKIECILFRIPQLVSGIHFIQIMKATDPEVVTILFQNLLSTWIHHKRFESRLSNFLYIENKK